MVRRFQDWKRWRPVLVELLISILLGAIIEMCLLVFEPPTLVIVRNVADETADKMIRLAERTTGHVDTATAFSFINIDDATWTSWGSPLVTPGDRIAELIKRAARSSPEAIVLDIDLAFQPDGKDNDPIRDALSHYPPDAPTLILVRSLIGAPPGSGRLPTARTTPYDGDTNGHDNIVWASPLFDQDGDGSVRRWRLYNPVCDASGRPAIVPSTHLVAGSLARNAAYRRPPDSARATLDRLDAALAAFIPPDCDHAGATTEGIIDDLPRDRPIVITEDDISSRVIYRVAWTDRAIGLGPMVETAHGKTQLVAIRPAATVLAADAAAPIPGLASRIVVIGGSFAESGDWHNTPIGRMPGALMVINAIEALTLNGTPREPDAGTRILISFSIIVIASLLTSFLRPSVAGWSLAFGISLLMVISIGRFKSGVMLDLAVPAVGALFHDISESIYHAIRDWRRLGWRWLLKPHPAADHPPVAAPASPAAAPPPASHPPASAPEEAATKEEHPS